MTKISLPPEILAQFKAEASRGGRIGGEAGTGKAKTRSRTQYRRMGLIASIRKLCAKTGAPVPETGNLPLPELRRLFREMKASRQ